MSTPTGRPVLPDGTARRDLRDTLRTDDDGLLAVRSDSIRSGPEVLERLARGDAVDHTEYTFRTSTHIESR